MNTLCHCTRAFTTAALLTAAVSAQALTIVDGNMTMTTGALSATSHSPRAFALRADALATDHGFEHWWYYRVAGDTRESALRDLGPVSGGVPPFLSHADRDFGDLDSRGLLRANVDYDTYDSGPSSGVLTGRITFTNISAAPVTFDAFCYTDLDLAASFGNDVVTGNGQHHSITDITGISIDIRADGADHSDVDVYPNVRSQLTDTAVGDLADHLPPFSGDYTGAFQWSNRTLQPGEQRSFTVVFAIDTAALQVPAVEHYGVGSTLTSEIYTDTLPLQDNANLRQIGIHLKGAPAFAPVGLLSNTQSAPGLSFSGLLLWVDPSSPAQFPIGLTNATGDTSVVLLIPPSPYLTGFPIFHQYFFMDNTAPNGASIGTTALMTRVGKL